MPMKLAMLGVGHTHAHGIVRQIAAHPDEFALVGFHDADSELLADRRAAWHPLLGTFRTFDTPAALLAEELDGVIVEALVPDNVSLARLALESGRPVLLEKPAGADGAAHRRLIELAREKRLHVQMLYLFRYMPAIRAMLGSARRGELGRIYRFLARLPKDLPSYDHNVAAFGRFTGGIFFEMAGHVIDMMVALLGRPDSVTPFLAHHHAGPGTFRDNSIAVFGYPHAWAMIEVTALEAAPDWRRIEVFGTEGAFVIPHLGSGHLRNADVQPVEAYRAGDAGWRRVELPAEPLQLADLREFAAVVAGRKAPDYDMGHDVLVQELLLRASGVE